MSTAKTKLLILLFLDTGIAHADATACIYLFLKKVCQNLLTPADTTYVKTPQALPDMVFTGVNS